MFIVYSQQVNTMRVYDVVLFYSYKSALEHVKKRNAKRNDDWHGIRPCLKSKEIEWLKQ